MSITELTDSDETDNEIHQIDNGNITSSSSTDVSSHNENVKLMFLHIMKMLNYVTVIILIIVIVKEN